MVNVVKWFEWDEPLESRSEEFVATMRDWASRWSDVDPGHSQVYLEEDRIVLGMDISDEDRRVILRTLRVDYGSFGVIHGEDSTGQFVRPLDPSCHEYGALDHAIGSPEDLADRAAAWMHEQMIRPIELREWRKRSGWFRRYHLVDTGRALCWSANDNEPLVDPGQPVLVDPVRTILAHAS